MKCLFAGILALALLVPQSFAQNSHPTRDENSVDGYVVFIINTPTTKTTDVQIGPGMVAKQAKLVYHLSNYMFFARGVKDNDKAPFVLTGAIQVTPIVSCSARGIEMKRIFDTDNPVYSEVSIERSPSRYIKIVAARLELKGLGATVDRIRLVDKLDTKQTDTPDDFTNFLLRLNCK